MCNVICCLQEVMKMISRISSGIVKALLKNNIIEVDENEIYQYGIEMAISTIVMIFIVLGCGLMFGELIPSVVFFLLFALIRSSSGGYHAETHFKCNLIYTVNLIIALFWVKFAPPFYSLSGHIMFLLIYILTVYQFSPVENPNKPLDNSQKRKHRTLCIIYGISLTVVSLIAWYVFNQIKYAVLITSTLISISFAMAVEILRKGGKGNEKDSS